MLGSAQIHYYYQFITCMLQSKAHRMLLLVSCALLLLHFSTSRNGGGNAPDAILDA